MSNLTAIRGTALSYTKDPFQNPVEDCYVYESDALIVMQDGLITEFGAAVELLDSLPDGVDVTNVNLGPRFPNGIFTSHSSKSRKKTVQVCAYDDLSLEVDRDYWDPRNRPADPDPLHFSGTPLEAGYHTLNFEQVGVSRPTAEKPQSKLNV